MGIVVAYPRGVGWRVARVHQKVFQEFDRICTERKAGGDVLEIGAMDSPDTLLRLPSLRGARSKIRVNLSGDHTGCRDFYIMRADANQLTCFPDASFDTILSNSVLEHDRFFWRSLGEMRRVARRGAVLVIGVPGYTVLRAESLLGRVSRLPILRMLMSGPAAGLAASTLCLKIHLFPGDYYRFSPQAVREVFLEGLLETEVRTVMTPPRIIGIGVKG
jgi:SAM-dependent methyltransferase